MKFLTDTCAFSGLPGTQAAHCEVFLLYDTDLEHFLGEHDFCLVGLCLVWPVMSEACQAPKLITVRFFPTLIPPSVKCLDLVNPKCSLRKQMCLQVDTVVLHWREVSGNIQKIYNLFFSQDILCACLLNL